MRILTCSITAALMLDVALGQQPAPLRPPAVPLVTHDPYFSVWSFRDTLTEDWTRHWTGAVQAMCGLCRIDGQPYRFLGLQPAAAPPMAQVRREVWPTRTIYAFEAGNVRLTLTFLTPLLPADPDLLARPVTYVSCAAESLDGAPHDVRIYLDCSAEWAVDRPDQEVNASRSRLPGLSLLRVASHEQDVLGRSGDNLRIDWGCFYVVAPTDDGQSDVIAGHDAARAAFVRGGALPDSDDLRFPRPVRDDWPVLACVFDLGRVGRAPVERRLMLVYDDRFCIEYFQRRLRPWWRRAGAELDALLSQAHREYAALAVRCQAFDTALRADLVQVGGERYADLAVLAYRQCLAAHKLAADFDGRPLMFSKENFSNGCIATVDVIYPASPFFLLLNPRLLEAQLLPVLEYAASPRWPHPFAPHDLGTYPLANGQVYGDGERGLENQMPVEESANMLILLAALTRATGDAQFAAQHRALLGRWADYLLEKGLDPENQLCTDDFAGHLAHNANLSLKAILALAAYAQVLERLGVQDDARTYRARANEMAARWQALAADGDHYRLAFDQPGTWSQKYNLVWDEVLGLKLFPPELAATEIAFYKSKLNRFGLPLDHRADYTKLDWCIWTAALTSTGADFDAFIAPLHDFVNQSPSRVPLTDWFSTLDGRQIGFQARSVVGGVYMPLLRDPAIWKKWSAPAMPAAPP